jgi:hypothetical protein
MERGPGTRTVFPTLHAVVTGISLPAALEDQIDSQNPFTSVERLLYQSAGFDQCERGVIMDAFLIDSTHLEPIYAFVLLKSLRDISHDVFNKNGIVECLHGYMPLVMAFEKWINRRGS